MVDVLTPNYRCPTASEVSSSGGDPPYIPSDDLVRAVNLTIFLERRPLLLKGEPGSGKTRLAKAVADQLGLEYVFWPVKSTSRSRDGLYTYDAIRRLQDAQLHRRGDDGQLKAEDPNNYITPGPLWRAFRSNQRAVVLIDEIDKADIDFPNDLLLELDEQWFNVEETGDVVRANKPPIIFITSNDEKDLPDAFLRRCLFQYIRFPDKNQLCDIVRAHFPGSPEILVDSAVSRFERLRGDMSEKSGKKVSTSELLDWFAVLRQNMRQETFSELSGRLLYPQVLLKSWQDYMDYYIRSQSQVDDDRISAS